MYTVWILGMRPLIIWAAALPIVQISDKGTGIQDIYSQTQTFSKKLDFWVREFSVFWKTYSLASIGYPGVGLFFGANKERICVLFSKAIVSSIAMVFIGLMQCI